MNRRPLKHSAALASVVWCFAGLLQASAAVRLPHVIGDNMVLQCDRPVPIWGWADPGQEVTVTFGGQKKTTTADRQGRWKVVLDKLSATSRPQQLTVTAGQSPGKQPAADADGPSTVVRRNVLVGEVWVCSGQSNMELYVQSAQNARAELQAADYPEIRLLLVPKCGSRRPLSDLKVSWRVCNGRTVRKFSAVGYFFGRELHKELKVPVGLISAAVGGSAIEAWAPSMRGGFYNGMIHPVVPFAVRGIIWYQGETNAMRGDGMRYLAKQKAMIDDWRKAWGRPEMSFYYVQIAPCASWYKGDQLPIFWQAQRACLSIPHTGMVVTTDLVSSGIRNIHPRNKQDVAKRLALWALAKDYSRRNIVYSGPLYKGLTVRDGKAILSFDHVGGGLTSRDGKELTHFTIAGDDGKFVKARATIARSKGSKVPDTIIVSSPEVPQPVVVRFAWDQTARPNLVNKEGLPASPFTTESFEDLCRLHKPASSTRPRTGRRSKVRS